MSAAERDPLLHRLERDAALACAIMAGLALMLQRGDPAAAAGVLGGGALSGLSYRAIKGGIDVMLGHAAARQPTRVRWWWSLVKFFTRYAILGFAAYALLVWLRLHPVGLLAGASSLVIAAAAQAIRGARPSSGPVVPKE